MMEIIKRRSIVERREIAVGSEIAWLVDLPAHAVLRVDHGEEGSILVAEWTRLEADEEVITRLATVYAGTPAENQREQHRQWLALRRGLVVIEPLGSQPQRKFHRVLRTGSLITSQSGMATAKEVRPAVLRHVEITPAVIKRGVDTYRSCSTDFDDEGDIVVEIFRQMMEEVASSSGQDVELAVPPTTMRPSRR